MTRPRRNLTGEEWPRPGYRFASMYWPSPRFCKTGEEDQTENVKFSFLFFSDPRAAMNGFFKTPAGLPVYSPTRHPLPSLLFFGGARQDSECEIAYNGIARRRKTKG